MPHYKKNIEELEKIQRRAIKMLPKLRALDYEERLREIDLPPLIARRNRADLIESYKLLSNNYNTKVETLKVHSKEQAQHNKRPCQKTV